jgi:hypothetical protein
MSEKFGKLIEYIDAQKNNEWGWKCEYEKNLCGGEANWATLAGWYSSLLNDAISLIPPAFIDRIRAESEGENE